MRPRENYRSTSEFGLKPTHKLVLAYYAALAQFDQHRVTRETAVRQPFLDLLRAAAGPRGLTVEAEFPMSGGRGNRIVLDAILRDAFWRPHGYWEAKDSGDDLEAEARRKFDLGYPRDNILFQAPNRAILFQNAQRVLDTDLAEPKHLVGAVNAFLAYTQPVHQQWDEAVADFSKQVPDLGQNLRRIIADERRASPKFVAAFADFAALCRASLNPNLRDEAIEEMLIQDLLTERLFRTVFKNPDFVRRNAIAHQIETVLDTLFARHYSRDAYLGTLDRFYRAIEDTAATLTDFSLKQKFLNTVYEKFLQGFCVKVADTHGIVYTPPPIVQFMVASVEHLLQKHFGKSLASPNVHILDPFGGTGNFTVHVMQAMPRSALPHKYAHDLWTNEIMLLPYYVGCMNLEHAYYEATGEYLPFPGACLVDTFETAEKTQHEFGFMAAENTERVKRQKKAPIFVVLSNPPYNAWQANENDNNKNRKYAEVDRSVAETYAADSKASNKNSLSDPYIKAIRWASNRIGEEGIVAFVTNNGFIDGIACDGMRKHLLDDFTSLYVLDLKGNIRKDSMRDGIPLGEKHTVFGLGAMVGISICFLVRNSKVPDHKLFLHEVPFRSTRTEKFKLLEEAVDISGLEWKEIKPDKRYNWLIEGMSDDFESFLPMGSKDGDGEAIFALYSNGVKTNRDVWAWNFRRETLGGNMKRLIETYNDHVLRWPHRADKSQKPDDFVIYDETKIGWSRDLKQDMQRGRRAEYSEEKVRSALYRPFTKAWLFFDRLVNEEIYSLNSLFPKPTTENLVIGVTDIGAEKPFMALAGNCIADLHLASPGCGTQCFPFYTYAADGSGRRENVTDWALAQFRQRYADPAISKWDVFHYVYAVLHHPEYRARYAANLRRELPRIPFVAADVSPLKSASADSPAKKVRADSRRLLREAEVFHAFAAAGKRLAELHVGYEQQPEYPLQRRENPKAQLNWRVEKMRLSKDKSALAYNDFLTLEGIPPKTFDYRLGNRSALEWVIDQYQVSTDQRSGITNDPNRPDDPQYILRLLAQVITVSLETVKVVKALPAMPSAP